MKERSLFSISPEHKRRLKEMAKEEGVSMTGIFELMIDERYNESYREYLKNPDRDDPRN